MHSGAGGRDERRASSTEAGVPRSQEHNPRSREQQRDPASTGRGVRLRRRPYRECAFSIRAWVLFLSSHIVWQDLRTAREGADGFNLSFGACAVAVSLGVGRLWPRNPHTGSGCSVAFLRVSRKTMRCGSLLAAHGHARDRPDRRPKSARASPLLPY